MKRLKFVGVSLLLLWMAGGCQQSLAPRMAILDAVPDFILVVVACLSLFVPRWSGSLIGFAGGLLHGAVAGANMAAYVVSRTVAGFASGWLGSMEPDMSLMLGSMTAFLATLIAQLLLMFGAPPPAILPFLLATIATAIYNGVIAVPVFALLRWVLDPPGR